MQKVKAIQTYIDLKNVESLLKKEPLDGRGNCSEKELDEALVNQEGLPNYLFDYLEGIDSVEEQLRHFSKVFITFFREMEKKYSGFLKEYFRFEREWRALLAGYRAKKLGIDPAKALQHENSHDPFVAEILAQKDTPFFEFPFEYQDLGEKLKNVQGDPKGQHQVMMSYRFHRIEEMIEDIPFSLDRLLGYLVELMIVEDVHVLDEQRGSENLDEMVKGNI